MTKLKIGDRVIGLLPTGEKRYEAIVADIISNNSISVNWTNPKLVGPWYCNRNKSKSGWGSDCCLGELKLAARQDKIIKLKKLLMEGENEHKH